MDNQSVSEQALAIHKRLKDEIDEGLKAEAMRQTMDVLPLTVYLCLQEYDHPDNMRMTTVSVHLTKQGAKDAANLLIAKRHTVKAIGDALQEQLTDYDKQWADDGTYIEIGNTEYSIREVEVQV